MILSLCQSFTLHFMDEQCLPFVEANYVVICVWMDESGDKKLRAHSTKNKTE